MSVVLLIPGEIWEEEKSELLDTNSEATVLTLADRLGISPAIVAGRIRWKAGDYRRFGHL